MIRGLLVLSFLLASPAMTASAQSIDTATEQISIYFDQAPYANPSLRIIQVGRIKDQVFGLSHEEYLQALEYLRNRWSQKPQQALMLAMDLQQAWESRHGNIYLIRYYEDLEIAAKAGMVLAAVGGAYSLWRRPSTANTYWEMLKSFSIATLPAVAVPGSEALRYEIFSDELPMPPAAFFGLKQTEILAEISFEAQMDEMLELAAGIGVTSSISALMKLRDAARVAKQTTSKASRVAKHLVVGTAVFWATEQLMSQTITRDRWEQVITRLGTRMDELRSSETDSATALENFVSDAQVVQGFLREPVLRVFQETEIEQVRLELAIAEEKESGDVPERLQMFENELELIGSKLAMGMKNAYTTSSCYHDFDLYWALTAALSGDEVYFQNQLQVSSSYVPRMFERYRLRTQGASEAEYQSYLQIQLTELKTKLLQAYASKDFCEHPGAFSLQTYFYLNSLDLPTAAVYADRFAPTSFSH